MGHPVFHSVVLFYKLSYSIPSFTLVCYFIVYPLFYPLFYALLCFTTLPCPIVLFHTIVLFVILLSILIFSLFITSSSSSNFTTQDVILLKSFALVVYTCTVGCLATINFSFAFFLAVFTVPPYLFVNVTKSR